MDGSLPTLAIRIITTKAGVVVPGLIEKIDIPVGKRCPDNIRKRINEAGDVVFHCGPSLRDATQDATLDARTSIVP